MVCGGQELVLFQGPLLTFSLVPPLTPSLAFLLFLGPSAGPTETFLS